MVTNLHGRYRQTLGWIGLAMCRFGFVVCFGWLLVCWGCAHAPHQTDLQAKPAPRRNWKRSEKATAKKQTTVAPQELVLREYRFVAHSRELNAEGEDQLERMLGAVRETSVPVEIESDDPASVPANTLAAQRRDYVVQRLLSRGVADAEARVIIRSAFTR